ncbi:MAG TPA: flagellar basal body rod protein FlgB [Alphaproteobacteria bacterium]|nr:flagellar basal body rod protein FlgB [Alphaproteobacteria bacterium]
MDFTKIPLFSAMNRRMTWLGQRQELLAQNIANADTPGYVAQDFKAQDFSDVLKSAGANGSAPLRMAATASGHIGFVAQGSGADGRPPRAEKTPGPEKLLSGNAVTLEEEMMKTAQTAMDFQLTTNLYKKHISMIKTALGRGGV